MPRLKPDFGPPQPVRGLTRRRLLLSGAALLSTPAWAATPVVDDITGMNPTRVRRIAQPRRIEDVVSLLRASTGPVSIGGSRCSMGGQIASPDSLHLDMRGLNRITALDARRRTARVQTGACWRDLQGAIDPHDLSVKIMQSYADFTVGGALSVNCHGRYVGAGPVVNSVRRIVLVLADGRIVEASRTENADIFYGAIGGYGGLGIIVEAELDLVPNTRLERHVQRLPLADYPDFFRHEVRLRPGAVLHNADIDLRDFSQVTAITWSRTERSLTQAARLHPADERYGWDRAKLWALGHVPAAQALRRSVVDPLDHAARPVVWRNYQASLGVASLGPISGGDHSHVLQEYFVPVGRFQAFARDLSAILARHQVQALNISIRHAPADAGTLLSWAPQEVFSFVLYYRQATSPQARAYVRDWTRQAIAAALKQGGRYYLPYQLHATPAQFHAAYPGAARFLVLKKSLDPANRFRNRLWDTYGV